MKPIDRFLDGITMYRLLLYYLILLLLVATVMAGLGRIGLNPLAIVLSSLYLVAVCWLSNTVFARMFRVPANVESSHITALILALIITPVASLHNALFLTAAGVLAMASKYILAVHKKHFFNPAAIAVLLTSYGAGQTASWWVGTVQLLPVVVLGGLLVARKIRRLRMVFVFLVVAFVSTIGISWVSGANPLDNMRALLLHSSLFFLGLVMLTEPLTTPPTALKRDWYALLVGVLFPPQMHLLSFYSTPELALCIGNVFSYFLSPKVKLLPRFLQKLQLAPDIMDFVFVPERAFPYKAGQYVEVTLGHRHADDRGNRRYFTLASSPTEVTLRLGVKFYPGGSSFKRALHRAGHATRVLVSPPAGDFVLPEDSSQKLAFIAGGIGVTPFRSMMKYLLDTNERRDVVLLYAERNPEEFVYTEVFEAARAELGMRTSYVAQEAYDRWQGHVGRISADMIRSEMPDYHERVFYISGSFPMVTNIRQALADLGVPASQVKTDYFPGYA